MSGPDKRASPYNKVDKPLEKESTCSILMYLKQPVLNHLP